MKTCHFSDGVENIQCLNKHCQSKIIEKVKVFNLITDHCMVFKNTTTSDALMMSYLGVESINDVSSENRFKLEGLMSYGSKAIRLGNYSVSCSE